MTFTFFILLIFIDIVIVLFAIETKIYSNIILSIKKIIPHVTIGFIILSPLFFVSLLITICNMLFINLPEHYIVSEVNNRNILMELKYFGLDIIKYSPIVLLVSSFILQSDILPDNAETDETIDEINIKNIKLDKNQLKISMIFNYTVAPKPNLPFLKPVYKVVRRRQPTTANNSVC